MLFRRSRPEHAVTFRTQNVGSLLMMRLAAFIEDTNASLQSINDDGAVLDLGGPTWGDRVLGRKFAPAVRLQLTFTHLDADTARSWNRQTEIDLTITPRSRRSPQFDAMASHVSRELRGYFASV